jgi:hypothetical protein
MNEVRATDFCCHLVGFIIAGQYICIYLHDWKHAGLWWATSKECADEA